MNFKKIADTSFKDSIKVNYKLCIKTQFRSVFLDIAKIADFR